MLKQLLIPIFALLIALSSFSIFSLNANSSKSEHFHCPNLKNTLSKTFVDVLEQADTVLIIDLSEGVEKQLQAVKESDAEKIKAILLSDDSYIFGTTKFSMFIPSTKLVFKKENQERTLLLSRHAKKAEFIDENGQILEMIDIRDEHFLKLDHIFNCYLNK